MFPFGSIVLTHFPLHRSLGNKRRPALVISRDNDRRPDLVVCFITSLSRMGPIWRRSRPRRRLASRSRGGPVRQAGRPRSIGRGRSHRCGTDFTPRARAGRGWSQAGQRWAGKRLWQARGRRLRGKSAIPAGFRPRGRWLLFKTPILKSNPEQMGHCHICGAWSVAGEMASLIPDQAPDAR